MSGMTVRQVADAGLDDWRLLATGLHARFAVPGMPAGLALVADVVEAAERADHHPDVVLRPGHVDLVLVSHDVGRVTRRDLSLARRVSDLAAARGLAARPEQLAQLELALDTADLAAVGPFWAALLTGDPGAVSGDDVVDRRGRLPVLWFQGTDAHATPRQRFHVDVWVPHDVAEQRVEVAVAAGGRVVDASTAPAFVVVEDAEGNRACVCTALGR